MTEILMGIDQTAYALRHTIETLRAPGDARIQRDTVGQSLAFAHDGQLKHKPAAHALDELSRRMGSRAAVAAACLPDNIVRYQAEHDADSEPAALAPAVRDVIAAAERLKRKLAVMRAARGALDNPRLRDLFRSSTPRERALSDALFAVADAYLALEATLGVALTIIEMIDMPQLPMSPIERLMHGFAPAPAEPRDADEDRRPTPVSPDGAPQDAIRSARSVPAPGHEGRLQGERVQLRNNVLAHPGRSRLPWQDPRWSSDGPSSSSTVEHLRGLSALELRRSLLMPSFAPPRLRRRGGLRSWVIRPGANGLRAGQ